MRPLDGITVVTLEHAIAAPFVHASWRILERVSLKLKDQRVATLRVLTIRVLKVWLHILCGPIVLKKV